VSSNVQSLWILSQILDPTVNCLSEMQLTIEGQIYEIKLASTQLDEMHSTGRTVQEISQSADSLLRSLTKPTTILQPLQPTQKMQQQQEEHLHQSTTFAGHHASTRAVQLMRTLNQHLRDLQYAARLLARVERNCTDGVQHLMDLKLELERSVRTIQRERRRRWYCCCIVKRCCYMQED